MAFLSRGTSKEKFTVLKMRMPEASNKTKGENDDIPWQ